MGEDSSKGTMSRRDLLKIGLAVGGASAAAATGAVLLGSLLRPPETPEVYLDTIHYRRFPTDQWWNVRDGAPMRVTDFQEWQGATGHWRALVRDGAIVRESGVPVVVVRVKRDDTAFTAPPPGEVPLPDGHHLYYDDPARDIRIVVVCDRSTYRCCPPGWHVVMNPPPARDYVAPSPTYERYGLDPIYDACHGGQWDPMALEWGTNPHKELRYFGARMVRRPGFGPLPLVPVRAEDDVLVGRSLTREWYEYCDALWRQAP